eukprot:gnl/Hemi2/1955_TR699_c0_g1_i1.p1 gnl/Hemi2/1955_TR699_c0_g1~~gnl/Hemi2/1955_TR699_c0_g1_i1.p1  ORF type:complete len:485 (+),score=89.42 gnl/Hemi2/1955_TR699_c0_g1_i1:114-1568(+)
MRGFRSMSEMLAMPFDDFRVEVGGSSQHTHHRGGPIAPIRIEQQPRQAPRQHANHQQQRSLPPRHNSNNQLPPQQMLVGRGHDSHSRSLPMMHFFDDFDDFDHFMMPPHMMGMGGMGMPGRGNDLLSMMMGGMMPMLMFGGGSPRMTHGGQLEYEDWLDIQEMMGDVNRGASEQMVKKTTESKSLEKRDGDQTCVVCMSDLKLGEKVRVLPCKHFYHVECIDEWLRRNKTCPVCKHPIDVAHASQSDSDSKSGRADEIQRPRGGRRHVHPSAALRQDPPPTSRTSPPRPPFRTSPPPQQQRVSPRRERAFPTPSPPSRATVSVLPSRSPPRSTARSHTINLSRANASSATPAAATTRANPSPSPNRVSNAAASAATAAGSAAIERANAAAARAAQAAQNSAAASAPAASSSSVGRRIPILSVRPNEAAQRTASLQPQPPHQPQSKATPRAERISPSSATTATNSHKQEPSVARIRVVPASSSRR